MDNFAHTLFGLALAKAGLQRATPMATAALVVSSNLPDIDVIASLSGGTVSHLSYHRGITHSFLGVAVLAALITLALTYAARRFQFLQTRVRGPVKPMRLFWLSCLGGLGHVFFDFTNSYGVRPLLPFSGRWFYGDLAFVVDPWIWLILGSSVVWLTANDKSRTILWIVIGILTSLLIFLVRSNSSQPEVVIPATVRLIWFSSIALIVAGVFRSWKRAGSKLARWSLGLLALYYCGMVLAHESAMARAKGSVGPAINSIAVWPVPADPFLWQSVSAGDAKLYTGYIDLTNPALEHWREVPVLEPRFLESLRGSELTRPYLEFARYSSAHVTETGAGYGIDLRDLRFTLRMEVQLDHNGAVRWAQTRWY